MCITLTICTIGCELETRQACAARKTEQKIRTKLSCANVLIASTPELVYSSSPRANPQGDRAQRKQRNKPENIVKITYPRWFKTARHPNLLRALCESPWKSREKDTKVMSPIWDRIFTRSQRESVALCDTGILAEAAQRKTGAEG